MYAVDLALCAIGYTVLQAQIINSQGSDSMLHQAVGSDFKGKVSLVSYFISIPLALLGLPLVAGVLLAAVSLIWPVRDRR